MRNITDEEIIVEITESSVSVMSGPGKGRKPWSRGKKAIVWGVGLGVPIAALAIALPIVYCHKNDKDNTAKADDDILSKVGLGVRSDLTLNETNFDKALINDFILSNSTEPINIQGIKPITAAAPSSDGHIEYEVTLKLRNNMHKRKVQVPYEVLINNLSVSSKKPLVLSLNWNKLKTTDFMINLGRGSDAATIIQATPPSQEPSGLVTSANYKVVIKLASLTRELEIPVPYLNTNIVVQPIGKAILSNWDKLGINDFIVKTLPNVDGFTIKDVKLTSSALPIGGLPIKYDVTYSYDGIDQTTSVDVGYDNSLENNTLINAVISYLGSTLNELSFDKLTKINFAVNNSNISIDDVQIANPTAPIIDGNISYMITMSFNGVSTQRLVQVPYEALINKINVVPKVNLLNSINWDSLTVGDFEIQYPSGLSSGASFTINKPVIEPLNNVVTYTATLKFGNSTKIIPIDIPYQKLDLGITPSKVLDSLSWDKLTKVDFSLNPATVTAGVTIADAKLVSTAKPTLTKGNVTYEITYEFNGVQKKVNIDVPYDNSLDVLNNATVSYLGNILNETNFGSALANSFNVTTSTGDNIIVSDVKVDVLSAPSIDGNINYKITISLNGQSVEKTIQVPYETLINKISGVSSKVPLVHQYTFDKLTTSDFVINYPLGISSNAVISKVTVPQAAPSGNDAVYVVTVSNDGITKDFTVHIPYASLAPVVSTIKKLNANNWDKLNIGDFSVITNPAVSGFAISQVVLHPGETLPALTTGKVKYDVSYTFNGSNIQTTTIEVDYDNTGVLQTLEDVIITYNGNVLNEVNFDSAVKTNFITSDSNVTIENVVAVPSVASNIDGLVEYHVTVKTGTTTLVRSINVPYEVLINKLGVSANQSGVNVIDWDHLTKNNFTINFNGVPQPATIENVTMPQIKPINGNATYAVTLKLGPLTRVVNVTIPYTDLVIVASTLKTIDSSNWNTLQPSDFILQVLPATSGFNITNVAPITGKPSTTKGVVTYQITYSYNGINKTVNVDVPYDNTLNVLNNATINLNVGVKLFETNFNLLTAADFNLSNLGDPNVLITNVTTGVSTAPSNDGNIAYNVTLSLNNQTIVKTIQVPYVKLIDKLNVVSKVPGVSTIGSILWSALGVNDFNIIYPEGFTSGATIISVVPPLSLPLVNSIANYTVTVKVGTFTKVFVIGLPVSLL